MSNKPYRAEGWENTVVNDADGNTLCLFPGGTLEEAKANAVLFAAAPELLTAAQELLAACVAYIPGGVADWPEIETLQEAIRKATSV